MSRANVRYFEERGLFTCNSGAGYDLDQCRDKYIAHLRSEFRKNPRAELEADFQKHKSRWLQVRIAKAEGELIPATQFDQAIDTMAGDTLTALAGVPSRLFPRDLAERQRCEGIIRQVRQELADKALARAGTLRDAMDKEATHGQGVGHNALPCGY